MKTVKCPSELSSNKFDKFGGGYAVIPLEDRQKVRKLGAGLQDYWLDCWEADPFGTRWVLLHDDPANTTKANYRKQLTKLGLFLFEKRGSTGNWSIWCLNLRGSRVHLAGRTLRRHIDEYGMPQVPLDTIEWLQQLLDTSEESGDAAEEKLDGVEQKIAETPAPQRKKIVSISPQDRLKDDLEAEKNKQPPLPLEEAGRAEMEQRPKFVPKFEGQYDPGYSLDELRWKYQVPVQRNHALWFATKYGYTEADLQQAPAPKSKCPAAVKAQIAQMEARRSSLRNSHTAEILNRRAQAMEVLKENRQAALDLEAQLAEVETDPERQAEIERRRSQALEFLASDKLS